MPASTIWALASTTPASTLSASSATTSGNWKPSATRSPWNPPPSRHPSTRLDPAPLRYAGCCRLPTHRGFSDQQATERAPEAGFLGPLGGRVVARELAAAGIHEGTPEAFGAFGVGGVDATVLRGVDAQHRDLPTSAV